MLRHQIQPSPMPVTADSLRRQQLAIEARAGTGTGGIPITEKGAPSGVAPLDIEGKLPAQLTRISEEARLRLEALEVVVPAEGLARVGDEIRLSIHSLPTG